MMPVLLVPNSDPGFEYNVLHVIGNCALDEVSGIEMDSMEHCKIMDGGCPAFLRCAYPKLKSLEILGPVLFLTH